MREFKSTLPKCTRCGNTKLFTYYNYNIYSTDRSTDASGILCEMCVLSAFGKLDVDIELFEIKYLNISNYSKNRLLENRIKYVGELVTKSERDILKMRLAGRKTLYEIKNALGDMGLFLSGSV